MKKRMPTDMAGQRYGKLTVLRLNGQNPKTGAYEWRCRCVCGRPDCKGEVVIRSDILRSCRRTNCGVGARRKAAFFVI